ncbi:MAG TPA: peptidoglycan editing factor PgeF [Steroidobacteraceae bacterium]|nr:peptidoglycan editing factor PgeF [Steroidobacteraceae bacterium]
MNPGFLAASWRAPGAVRAGCTLRTGGSSAAPYASLNLGDHVGDDPAAVERNRSQLRAVLRLPSEPLWLQQVHGTGVLEADAPGAAGRAVQADAAVTRQAGRVLAILVADCMPVLFASADGTVLAAAHAGWRGLCGGVLESTVHAMRVEPRGLHAWLGPAIGVRHFEVGEEVRAAFVAHDAGAAAAFAANARGRWQCDLGALARQRLAALGVTQVTAADVCTYSDAARCYSYRRDGRTGRMAALLWRPGTTD